MSAKKRIFLIFVTLAIAFIYIFPSFYISSEVNHSCIDDNCCSICHQISLCERIKKIHSNIPTFSLQITVLLIFKILCITVFHKEIRRITPVTLKVKLLN